MDKIRYPVYENPKIMFVKHYQNKIL